MRSTTTSRIFIAVTLIACLFAVGPASAYDPDTACTSMMEILNGSRYLSEIELVFTGTDDISYGYLTYWTDWTNPGITPKENLKESLQSLIAYDEEERYLKWVILSTVWGERRISYVLSPTTSEFERLPGPVESPERYSEHNDPENGPAAKIDRIAQYYFARYGVWGRFAQVEKVRPDIRI